jgi:hypothetical protein
LGSQALKTTVPAAGVGQRLGHGEKLLERSEFDPLELVRFIGWNFVPMNLICERGQMFERGIYDRSRAVFAYFDLPFDAEPPS